MTKLYKRYGWNGLGRGIFSTFYDKLCRQVDNFIHHRIITSLLQRVKVKSNSLNLFLFIEMTYLTHGIP